jgi:polyhydroxyalkanoate synthase
MFLVYLKFNVYIHIMNKPHLTSLFQEALIAAIHPEKVKNLITIATPGDFDLDNSLLSVWTRSMKEDYLLDAFGNVPGILLNTAFNLRRPVEYSHKYFHFFEQPHDLESIAEFFARDMVI